MSLGLLTGVSLWLIMLVMQLAEYFNDKQRGEKARLAKQIGVHATDLSDWISGARSVPTRHCLAVERATNGSVSRKDLRPGDFHLFWPELSDLATPDPAPQPT